MWAALMTAAAAIQVYDNHFLIEPMETCSEKLPIQSEPDPLAYGAFCHNCWLMSASPPRPTCREAASSRR